MLAEHEDALLAALRARPGIARAVRTVGTLPRLTLDQLLKRYAVDAPSIYLTEPVLNVADDAAVLTFSVPIMVRNVAGDAQARKGDGVALGIDQLFTLLCRAVHGKRIGRANWSVVRAALVEDDVFIQSGLTVMECTVRSSPVPLPEEPAADFALDELQRVHMDFDLAPHASEGERAAWLASPPDYTAAQPQLQADVQLPGSAGG